MEKSLAGKPIKEESVLVEIPSGTEFTFELKDYTMPSDTEKLVAIGLYPDEANKPPEMMTISVGTATNTDIVGHTSYKNYLDGKNGSYIERFKPVNIESKGAKLFVYFRTNETPTKTAYKFLLHFIYLKKSSC